MCLCFHFMIVLSEGLGLGKVPANTCIKFGLHKSGWKHHIWTATFDMSPQNPMDTGLFPECCGFPIPGGCLHVIEAPKIPGISKLPSASSFIRPTWDFLEKHTLCVCNVYVCPVATLCWLRAWILEPDCVGSYLSSATSSGAWVSYCTILPQYLSVQCA